VILLAISGVYSHISISVSTLLGLCVVTLIAVIPASLLELAIQKIAERAQRGRAVGGQRP